MYGGFYRFREYASVRREQLGGDVPALKRVFGFSLVLMFFEYCAQTVDAQFNSVAPTRRSDRRKRVCDVSPRSSSENVFQSKQTSIRGLAAPYWSSERYIGMCHEAGIDGAPLRRLAALATDPVLRVDVGDLLLRWSQFVGISTRARALCAPTLLTLLDTHLRVRRSAESSAYSWGVMHARASLVEQVSRPTVDHETYTCRYTVPRTSLARASNKHFLEHSNQYPSCFFAQPKTTCLNLKSQLVRTLFSNVHVCRMSKP
ncbi:hypothetical protein C8R43DRAFT_1115761 [Mycena crocata]|nr:hypothetical protein C8R43DRAFT_1115761 [Mycena crocata]